MIFTKEIKDSYGKDVRQYPAVITVPPGIAHHKFPNSIGTIGGLNQVAPLLRDFRSNAVLDIEAEAIFYHPVRKKWIIWSGSVCDARYQSNGIVSCPQHQLKLAFSSNEYEFIDPKQMLYPLDQIPVFKGMKLPVLPIRIEYADLLDLTKEIKFENQAGTQQYKISIPLLGTSTYFEVTYHAISNLEDVDIFLDVWPNLPDWKTYWITSSFYNLKNNQIIGLNKDWQIDYFACKKNNRLLINKIDEKPWRSYKDIPQVLVSVPIGEWPELISLYKGKTTGCLIYNPKPSHMPINSNVGIIGMDFGTARSVVCIADDGDVSTSGSFESYVQESYKAYSNHETFKGEAHLNPFKHRAKRIIENTNKATNDVKTGDFYAPITSHKQFSPSQNTNQPKFLIVETGLKHLYEAKFQNYVPEVHFEVPFNHFTLPMMSEGDPITEEGIALYSTTTPVNKWQSDPSAHTQNFLKELLCVSLAEYWSLYPQSNANLICSTPLAFSVANHKTFSENLTSAKKWLENEVLPSGSNFIWSGKTYPESVAVYTAAALIPIGNKNSLTVVADLGDSTLDISIWFEKFGSYEKKIVLSDSVKLGASVMFNCLKKFTHTLEYGDIYRLSYGQIQQKKRIPLSIWENFKSKVQEWLKLNIAYLARSILGTHYELKNNPKISYDLGYIHVLLAGCGWKTCEALEFTPDVLEKYLTKELDDQIQKLDDKFTMKPIVYSSLHRCGLDKVAIAGGLHKIRGIANIPVGLKAANGIDEITSDHQEIKWNAFVEETELWLGVSPKLADKPDAPSFSPPIPNVKSKYQSFNQQQLMMINHNVVASRTANGGRKRTMASVVFEQVLTNMLDEKK